MTNQSLKINPFKADVFSFGIIISELFLLERIRNKANFVMKSKQEALTKIDDLRESINEKHEFDKLLNILISSLEINIEIRPDFITLFKNTLDFKDKKSLKLHILIEETKNDEIPRLLDKSILNYFIFNV